MTSTVAPLRHRLLHLICTNLSRLSHFRRPFQGQGALGLAVEASVHFPASTVAHANPTLPRGAVPCVPRVFAPRDGIQDAAARVQLPYVIEVCRGVQRGTFWRISAFRAVSAAAPR